MKPLSVVIPSRTASNLVECIAAVRKHEPEARIIIVDDGIDENAVPDDIWCVYDRVMGEKPFIFARNANIGIRAAGDSDVVLLNDDALLESPGGFSLLQQAADEHPDVGVIGATTNVTGASHQWQRRQEGNGFRCVDHLAFVCVLIPYATRLMLAAYGNSTKPHSEKMTGGFLDERFVTYGWEDNDYIRQCKTAGLRIAVHDGCFVNHSKLKSTFRSPGGPGGDIEPGRKIYQAKWGTEFRQ